MSSKQRPAMIEAMEDRLHFNVVASLLSETIISSTLPAMTYNESVLKGSVTFKITNDATDSQTGRFAIGIYISAGGLDVNDPSSFGILSARFSAIALGPGLSRNYTLPVNIGKGKLALGTDTLYAVASSGNSPDSASGPGPTLTVVAGPPIKFSDTIISAKGVYTVAGMQDYADELDLKMAIHNTGGLTNGIDQFSLFASTSPTFDSTATKIGHVKLNLMVSHNGTRDFLINFGGLPNLGSGVGESDYYIYVQVTDTLGDVTMAEFHKQVALTIPR